MDAASERARRLNEALANPPPGQEICVTGISGYFPESDSVSEFWSNLLAGRNLVTIDSRRWPPTNPEIPNYIGKINDLTAFDGGFFGLHPHFADECDPLTRLYMERAVEAIVDAGVNPKELEGTKTGVYSGMTFADGEKRWMYDKEFEYGAIGCHRSSNATFLSKALKLDGPALVVDTACSSSMYALQRAYSDLRKGLCEMAIVVSGILVLHPGLSKISAGIGTLTLTGFNRCFDENSDGYLRAEATGAIFLQKAEHSKRIYAKIIHAGINCDGFKEGGCMYPSSESQGNLIQEVLTASRVDPNDINYFEAHCTGTKVGDPGEMVAVDRVICRKRKKPLLVGSVKCLTGHTEPASGVVSLIKVLCAMEYGVIPANTFYEKPKEAIRALVEGRAQVVLENTKFDKEDICVAINNLGFGGANFFMLVKSAVGIKVKSTSSYPVLLCVCSRVEDGLDGFEDAVKKSELDPEFIGLIHEVYRKNIETCRYRSYAILTPNKQTFKKSTVFFEEQKPLHIIFGKPTTSTTYNDFFTLPQLSGTFKRINKILSDEGIDLSEMQPSPLKDLLVTISVQLSLIDLLNLLEVNPTKMSAISIGRLAKAYWQRKVTLEEVVRCVCCLGNDSHGDSFKSYRSNGSKKNLFPPNVSDCFDDESAEVEVDEDDFVVAVGDCEAGGWVEVYDRKARCYNTLRLLDCLGKFYENGFDLDLSKIYPKIEFPVSRRTHMLSHLFKWDHRRPYFVEFYKELVRAKIDKKVFKVNFDELPYLQGHEINNKTTIPESFYVNAVLEILAGNLVSGSDLKVILEDIRFGEVIEVKKDLEFICTVLHGRQTFEVSENRQIVCSGKFSITKKLEDDLPDLTTETNDPNGYLPLKEADVYKKLKLSGHICRGLFRSVKQTNVQATEAIVTWDKNFVTFLDGFVHLRMLHSERAIHHVKAIGKIAVDAQVFGLETKDLSVKYDKSSEVIRCEGLVLTCMDLRPLPRKKPLLDVVLEKYVFVPYETELNLENSLRVHLQLVIENSMATSGKIIEIPSGEDLLLRFLPKIVAETSIFLPELIAITKKNIDTKEITIQTDNQPKANALLTITHNALTDAKQLETSLAHTKPNGYILTSENPDFRGNLLGDDLQVLATHSITNTNKKLILFRRNNPYPPTTKTLKIINDDYHRWLKPLLTSISKAEPLVVYSQNDDISGLLALFNCLRFEAGSERLRCVQVFDAIAPEFHLGDVFYGEHMRKDLAVNILRDGVWGSMRFLPVAEEKMQCDSCHLEDVAGGRLDWVEAPPVGDDSVTISCVGSVAGGVLEYSGVDCRNNKTMGLTLSKSIANKTKVDVDFSFSIPDNWTLEDAATVPGAYISAIYSLFLKTTITKTSSILIATKNPAITLATLNLLTPIASDIYVLIAEAHRRWFRENYPEIPDDHFADASRIESVVLKRTGGCGVDVILCDHLEASYWCLSPYGTVLLLAESVDGAVALRLFEKGRSLRGVNLEMIFKESLGVKKKLRLLFEEGVKSGCVKPLPREVIGWSGLDVGGAKCKKVVVRLDGREKAFPRFYCYSEKSYIVLGGLGGAGMELTDWLVRKGAKNIVISSRRGIKNGYQSFCINNWRNHGIKIHISTTDATSSNGCRTLITEACALGPVDGIFNLAVELPGAYDTVDSFRQVFAAKFHATAHLDTISRELCPELRVFAVFSTFSAGRGYVGYGNYGMANCIAEKICERRKREGLPGLAVEWGPIGDVGIFGEVSDYVVGGLKQQPIWSVLDTLEICLRGDEPVMSGMIVAEKSSEVDSAEKVLSSIGAILGIKDVRAVGANSTLADLGLDSIISVEIARKLEKDFGVKMDSDGIRKLTFPQLLELRVNMGSK